MKTYKSGQDQFHCFLNTMLCGKKAETSELKNQLFRATLSIPANIAEGFERYSAKEVYSISFHRKSLIHGARVPARDILNSFIYSRLVPARRTYFLA